MDGSRLMLISMPAADYAEYAAVVVACPVASRDASRRAPTLDGVGEISEQHFSTDTAVPKRCFR